MRVFSVSIYQADEEIRSTEDFLRKSQVGSLEWGPLRFDAKLGAILVGDRQLLLCSPLVRLRSYRVLPHLRRFANVLIIEKGAANG